MLALEKRGDEQHGTSPDACSVVNDTLAAIWPRLLSASNAADGPDPSSAAVPLRAAGELLLSAAARLR